MSEAKGEPMISALVGAGFMGDVHTRALRSAGIQIAGIASSSADKAERAAGQFGVDNFYPSFDHLLADERVNVVHILTPNQSHGELVAKALSAGKNVVCEKPLATDAAQAKELVELAEQRNLIGAVPFVYRFHPNVRQLRLRISDPHFGRLHSVKGEYLQDWLLDKNQSNWRVSASQGGASRAFADIGIHLCDLIEYVTGQNITRLIASKKIAHEYRQQSKVETEDTVAVIAELDKGALVSLLVSQVAAGHKNGLRVELFGEHSALSFNQEKPEELWTASANGKTLEMRNPGTLGEDASRLTALPAGHPEGYLDAFTSFMRDVRSAVAGRLPAGLPTFRDGLRGVRLTEAVLLSAQAERWVDL
jgi:predicted dehydrogenase